MVNAWSGSMNAATLSPTPTDLTITPRDRRFGREAATPRLWHGGKVEATALYNALSATFPLGEAFFVESVRAFRDGADPKLAEDIRNFTTQEVVHSRLLGPRQMARIGKQFMRQDRGEMFERHGRRKADDLRLPPRDGEPFLDLRLEHG